MRLKDLKTPFIIAEVGSNWKREPHDGLALALRHIELAAKCGANAVKFQSFTLEELYGVTKESGRYALPEDWLSILKRECDLHKVQFMCSAFSVKGVKKVNPYVQIHKIASSEANDPDIRAAVIATGKPFIISTAGMSQRELDDIERDLPDQDFIFMECVARYPAETEDYSLDHITGRTKGLSDHTLTNTLALGALSRGALVFEKHFSATKGENVSREALKFESPDYAVSVSWGQFQEYAIDIRKLFGAMNKSTRGFSDPQMHARWRRRLIALKDIKAKEQLIYGINFGSFRSQKEQLTWCSPEKSSFFHEKRTKRDINVGDAILESDVL